jgi:serine/threonine-protein kinase
LALAETYFLSAINLEPGNWHSWLALAEFYYVQCRYDEALGVLNDVVDLSPDNARAHLLMGASYFMDGNVDASLRETQRAIEIAPSRGAYRDLGLTHHTVGDYGAAVTAFMRALDLGPNDYWTWGSLGDTYAQITGRQDDALAAYRRASDLAEDLLARNPRDWRTLGLLAEYSVMIGNVDESIRRITTAVANAPRDFDVQISDVVIRSHLDQNEQALDALERAVELGCYPKRMIADDPRFSALRDDDRFKRIVSQSTEE